VERVKGLRFAPAKINTGAASWQEFDSSAVRIEHNRTLVVLPLPHAITVIARSFRKAGEGKKDDLHKGFYTLLL
jgi:hypothetical protein